MLISSPYTHAFEIPQMQFPHPIHVVFYRQTKQWVGIDGKVMLQRKVGGHSQGGTLNPRVGPPDHSTTLSSHLKVWVCRPRTR